MRRGAKSFVQKPWEDVTLLEIVRARDHRRPGGAAARPEAAARVRGRAPDPARAAADGGAADRRESTSRSSWQPANGVGGDCFDTIAFGQAARRLDRGHRRQGTAGSAADVEPAGRRPRLRAGGGCRPRLSARASTGCCAATWRAAVSRRSVTRASTPARRRIVYSNAGHNPPLLVRAERHRRDASATAAWSSACSRRTRTSRANCRWIRRSAAVLHRRHHRSARIRTATSTAKRNSPPPRSPSARIRSTR